MSGLAIRNAIGPALFLVAVGFLVARFFLGCTPKDTATLPRYCTEEALYTAKLVRCVDDSETLSESKACRERVDASCGIVQTVTVRK